jgi:hypothetical protein
MYSVPAVCFKSGPCVVVNLAESTFSGSKEFLKNVRAAVAAAWSLGADSSGAFSGIDNPKSAII